jgi:hypothetical protein
MDLPGKIGGLIREFRKYVGFRGQMLSCLTLAAFRVIN